MSDYKYIVAISETRGMNDVLEEVCRRIGSIFSAYGIPRQDSVFVHLGEALQPVFADLPNHTPIRYRLNGENTYGRRGQISPYDTLDDIRKDDSFRCVITNYAEQYEDLVYALSKTNLPVVACPGRFDIPELMHKSFSSRGWNLLHGRGAVTAGIRFYGYGGQPEKPDCLDKNYSPENPKDEHNHKLIGYSDYGLPAQFFTQFNEIDIDLPASDVDVLIHSFLPFGFLDKAAVEREMRRTDDETELSTFTFKHIGSRSLDALIQEKYPALDLSGLGAGTGTDATSTTLKIKCNNFYPQVGLGSFPIYLIRLEETANGYRVADNIDIGFKIIGDRSFQSLEPFVICHESYQYEGIERHIHIRRFVTPRFHRGRETGKSIVTRNLMTGELSEQELSVYDIGVGWAIKEWRNQDRNKEF